VSIKLNTALFSKKNGFQKRMFFLGRHLWKNYWCLKELYFRYLNCPIFYKLHTVKNIAAKSALLVVVGVVIQRVLENV
jgi:hypothetical protein